MKLFSFTLAAFSAVVLGAYPQTAKALPFKPTCEGMQAYANSLKWSTPTKFSNFTKSDRFFDMGDTPNCMGYITETSPMGRKVCYGTLTWNNGKIQWQADFVNNYGERIGECRYK